MKKLLLSIAFLLSGMGIMAQTQVTTAEGILEGKDLSGITVFKGIPFAAPPVGNLRWKAPQPVQKWQGVREAKEFGPNPMQEPIFGDMNFGTKKYSEDCLYLNIWTPAKTMKEHLPVLIYFNGGGLMAGSGSEPRYAGDAMARKGIISITANYREGIFGFFAHPQLSKETSYKGSGNYGFMDQVAAIQWVKDNIEAFGGDPNRITTRRRIGRFHVGQRPDGFPSLSGTLCSGNGFQWFGDGIQEGGYTEGGRGGRRAACPENSREDR